MPSLSLKNNIGSLSSRFRITISAPKVNTLVKATGESLCEDKATALITIKDSEEGVNTAQHGKERSCRELKLEQDQPFNFLSMRPRLDWEKM